MNVEVHEDQAHGDRKRGPSTSPGRHSMGDERMTMWEKWCLKQKKNEKQPGKGPKNL